MEPFKTAVPTVEPTAVSLESPLVLDNSKVEHVNSPSDMPPSLYVEANKPPLIIEDLGLSSYYGKLDTKELGLEIDGFINNEIDRLHLKNDSDTYKEMIKGFANKLSLDKIDDPFIRLDKIGQYVRSQSKLIEAMREQDELLAADPSELTAKGYKKMLELKYGVKTI